MQSVNPFEHERASRRITSFPAASRLIEMLLEDRVDSDAEYGKPQLEGYVIGRLLGEGGGGEVYVAYQEGSTVPLAIKFLKGSLGKAYADKRAWRELDILTELELDGVPPVRDYGIADGRFYIVTALVHGLTLDDHCREHHLDLRARVELIARIADLVHSMHEHGVMHRDLKPGNIVIQDDGRPAIIDFGIALLVGERVSTSVTAEGAPIGSVGYMSPEQARGDKNALSIRTDIYGIGATACAILTGKTPHDVDVPWHEAVRRTAQDPPRDPRELDPTLPKALAAIVARSIDPDPSHRYSSAALLAEDFRRWLHDEPIHWQRTTWIHQLSLAWRRNRRGFAVKAAMALLIAALFVTSTLALAQHKVAVGERKIAAETADLREQARIIALNVHEYEVRHQLRLKKQVEIVKLAVSQGPLFDASIALLTLGDEIEAEHLNDAGQVSRFVGLLHELIDKAKSQQQATEQLNHADAP